MTKAERKRLHAAINDLSYQQVADIVRETFPRARGERIDELAKKIIAGAHAEVSPKKK